MDRLKALPTWAKWTLGIVALFIVVGAAGGGEDVATDKKSAAKKSAPLDMTTLYNSVAQVFTERYNRFHKVSGSPLSPDSMTFCRDKKRPISCEMRVAVPIVSDESWFYDVTLGSDDCWTARTSERYGGNQDAIDSYRNRETLAPTADDVRRYVREADRLRSLRGCASNVVRPTAGRTPAEFIAGFAAQNVQRERPGRQKATTCDDLGKQELAAAPDSWDYACTTEMANGGAFVDKISCFDPPPYSDFGSCTEQEGYPKRPPRPLPE